MRAARKARDTSQLVIGAKGLCNWAKIFPQQVAEGMALNLSSRAVARSQRADNLIEGATNTLLGWMLGSPLGYAFPMAPIHVASGRVNNLINDSVSSPSSVRHD